MSVGLLAEAPLGFLAMTGHPTTTGSELTTMTTARTVAMSTRPTTTSGRLGLAAPPLDLIRCPQARLDQIKRRYGIIAGSTREFTRRFFRQYQELLVKFGNLASELFNLGSHGSILAKRKRPRNLAVPGRMCFPD